MGKSADIRQAVEAQLASGSLSDASRISVTNVGGDVALIGTVPSYPQYLRAAVVARQVAGVSRVHNHLEVVLPPQDHRGDMALTISASQALAAGGSVPGDVEAIAQDGTVTLSGTVRLAAQRDEAAAAVAGLTGVRNVMNQILIEDAADPADIALRVQEAVDRRALLRDDSEVAVEAGLNTVTLSGHVRTWAEHDAAISAARTASGVSDVCDNLHVTG